MNIKYIKNFRNISLLSAVILGFSTAIIFERPLNRHDKFARYLNQHPFNNREREEEGMDPDRPDRPDLAAEQDFLRTMNPALGRPTPENLFPVMNQLKMQKYFSKTNPGGSTTPWVERGPNNVGGRTRALTWDPNDATGKKVWAGGVTGGLWYNIDITISTSSWVSVNDFWSDLAVSCIAFDPINPLVMYVGTGEGFTANGSSTTMGAGIWKSTNGGTSWVQLSTTTGYYYVNDIVVRNESGTSVVYAAVDVRYDKGVWHGSNPALQRSVNGGSSWTSVNSLAIADIEIGRNNRLWIGTKSDPSGNNGGKILYSDNGTSWTLSNTTTVSSGGRVELSCAPSDSNTVYAIIEDNHTVGAMKKTVNGGSSWTSLTLPVDADSGIPTSDFSRGQAWYDLIMAVDPNDATKVVVGTIDLFYSTDAGSSWNQITQWYDMGLGVSVIHSDQHAIAFKPGSSSSVIFGCDGGVQFTNAIQNAAASSSVIVARNKNYNVTQFYACAMHPSANSNVYMAGAQDNGTQGFTVNGMNSTSQLHGGDGAWCFIDQTNPSYQIASYVYNSYYLSKTGGGTGTFNTTLVADQNTGRFINPAGYDNNLHILYSANDASSIKRISNITGTPSTPAAVSITGMTSFASHIRVSPYTTSSSTLFIGTESGKLYKVTNANGTAVSTDISGSSFPSGSISCIEIGASENELLVTFFNYGVTSVWYSANGGSTWTSKEGNLPDMPVRWALFNPKNRLEVILATELGIWSTSNLNSASPTWIASTNGLANVRVDMLQTRASDNQVIAATHGRGLYSCSNAFTASTALYAAFKADNLFPCPNQTVNLSDTSLNGPTSWNWTITPSTFIFTGGTDATSKNPQVQFTAAGSYHILLKVSNTTGYDSVMKYNYISVGGTLLPFNENWENSATYSSWQIVNPDNGITWAVAPVSGNGTSTMAMSIDNYDYVAAGTGTQRDAIVSPSINLAGYSSANLSFKHAYRRDASGLQDSLAVYITTDCGATWTRIGTFRETQSSSPYVFITNSNISVKFIPSTSTDWCGNTNYSTCKNISLSSFIGNIIRIKFENISNYGNNLYLDDISVTGTSNLPAPVADFAASATNLCGTGIVSFFDSTTNSPSQWNWTFSPNTVNFINGTSSISKNPVVSFNTSGTYSVSLTSTNSNSSNTLTKTGYITVSSIVTPTVNISLNGTSICSGQPATFNAVAINGGNAPSYQWKLNNVNVGTNTTSFTSSSLNTGDTLMCILTSNAVCTTINSANSNKIGLSINPSPALPVITRSGDTISCNITSGVTYQWYVDIYKISGATNPSYTLSQSGTYKVIVTNSSGCSSTSADFIAYKLGMKLLSGMGNFNLFPNPSRDIINLQFTLETSRKLLFTVFDNSGRKVYEETKDFAAGNQIHLISLWFLAKGNYTLLVHDDKSQMQRKVIID